MIQNSHSNEICYIFLQSVQLLHRIDFSRKASFKRIYFSCIDHRFRLKKRKKERSKPNAKNYTYIKLQQLSFFCLLWNAWNTIINNKTFTNLSVVDGRVNGDTTTSTAVRVSRTHSYINSNNGLQRTHSMKLNSYLIEFL